VKADTKPKKGKKEAQKDTQPVKAATPKPKGKGK